MLTRRPGLVKVAVAACELPQTRRCIAERLAEDIEKNPGPLNNLLGVALANPSPEFSRDILDGHQQAALSLGWAQSAQARRLGCPRAEAVGRKR